MSDAAQKRIIVIAGPNGAGKTTFARTFLPAEASITRFINADLIAAGLSPFHPELVALRAGRLMLEEMKACVARGDSFAFETTLAGRGYIRLLHEWRQLGYRITLVFLSLPDADAAVRRVATRVQLGGHHVPDAVVRRRFEAGLRNFELYYKAAVDGWVLYDNSGDRPQLMSWGENS